MNPPGRAELRPYPLAALVRRMFRELDEGNAIFDLPAVKFFLGDPARDLSVRFHDKHASCPFGPAAGPQSQMAQNLVLAWLGGARIIELKTVQVLDELTIPRPCIDMRTIGYNVEWSQELSLAESQCEYVKGAMLVQMLKSRLDIAPGFDRTIWDMSVGYDLAGIRSSRVQEFIRGLVDATPVIDALRREIPPEHAELRDLDFPRRLSGTLTLSTFHGCPPDEIERILEFLMRELGLHVVVKLNPLLSGPDETRRLVRDLLGYTQLRIPDSAFEKDTKWEQALGFVDRLTGVAAECGVGFGVKLSNTLVVENPGDFLPADTPESYVSGPPLHVLAMNLVRRFRRELGAALPISFSAGIDRANFADAVALGLVPVTACSDLLQPGGYGRARAYLEGLTRRMAEKGARNVDEWIVTAYGHGRAALERAFPTGSSERAAGQVALEAGNDLRAAVGETAFERWRAEAVLLNTETYVEAVTNDPRYRAARNAKPPKKVGSRLELLDCLTCDKCVPVCPNDANFLVPLPPDPIPMATLRYEDGTWSVREEPPRAVTKKHQIGNFVDFCNECGNCDVFCPEDGGPYVLKPRFHGSLDAFRADAPSDAVYVGRRGNVTVVHARVEGGRELALEREDGAPWIRWSGPGFDVRLDLDDPAGTAEGRAGAPIDLGWAHLLDRLGAAMLAHPGRSWVGALTL